MTPAENKYLSSLLVRVDVGDGAVMAAPRGELEWQLRYGNPEFVRFIAATVIESYVYLINECSLKEASHRIMLMRRALRNIPTANGGRDG